MMNPADETTPMPPALKSETFAVDLRDVEQICNKIFTDPDILGTRPIIIGVAAMAMGLHRMLCAASEQEVEVEAERKYIEELVQFASMLATAPPEGDAN